VLHLVRFGELSLKSRYVRRQLQDTLLGNLHEMFAAEKVECLTSVDFGRIYVRSDDDAATRSILSRTFGIVSFSPTAESPSDLPSICAAAAVYAKPLLHAGMSFAIRPRRSGTHSFKSQDIGREAGGAVWTAIPGLKVDLETPDQEIHIEVRENHSFVFHEVVPGPGGLPLGSQGRAVALIEKPRDIAAAWLVMRRGARTTLAAIGEESLAAPLRRWDPRLKIQTIEDPQDLAVTARAARAHAVVLPWGADSLKGFDELKRITGDTVPFFPLIGLSAEEIDALLLRIGA